MILFVGYYGFGNLGDEAILSTILAQFRARRPELRLVAASGDPANTTASHGVEAVAWNDMAAIHRAVQIADLVVIGGGGLFHDYWGVDPDTFLTDKHWGIAYYAGPALLATLYRKPLMLYAVGVGPLCSGHGVKLTRVAAQAAQVITVRDPGSKRVLQETGIPGDKIRVTADPAFAFQPALPSSLQHAVGPDFLLRRPILGAAPRHWSIGVHPDFLEREMASALDLFLEQTGGSVVLLPFQNLSGERENDRATATRIHEHMRLPEKAALAHGPITPDQAQCWLRDCDLVLGMRLHALIFAATAAVPAVALSYDPKIDDIVQQLGLEKFSVNVKDIAAPQLAERLIQALHRGEEDRTAMSLATAELRKAADENVSMAFDLLDAPPREAVLDPDSFDVLARSLFTGAQFARQSREVAQAAARDTARFAEDRDWLLSEQKVAAQQLAQAEERRQRVEEENRTLTQKLAETTQQAREAGQAAERDAARFVEDRDWLLSEKELLGKQVAEANERVLAAEDQKRALSEVIQQLREAEQAAAREAARFVEDRDWLLSEKDLLGKQLAEATKQCQALEQENLALSQRCRHAEQENLALTQRCQAAEQENLTLGQRLVDINARRRASEEAKTALQNLVDELRSKLRQAAEERQAVEASRDEYAFRLRQSDEARAWVQGEIDLYNSRLRNELAVYRSQRAWKMMLVCRKAYTLLPRSKVRIPGLVPGPALRPGGRLRRVRSDVSGHHKLRSSDLPPLLVDVAQAPRATDQAADATPSDRRTPPQRDRYDVVILAIIDFDFRFQRPQQIAAEFARQGHRVFWISPTRFPPGLLAARLRSSPAAREPVGNPRAQPAARHLHGRAGSRCGRRPCRKRSAGSSATGPSPDTPSWRSFRSGGGWP